MNPCQACGRSCATCLDLDLRRPHHKVQVYNSPIHLGKNSSSFKYDTRSLRQSATQGCKGCRLLLDGISCFRELWNGDETIGDITYTEGIPLEVCFARWQDEKGVFKTDYLEFYTIGGKLISYNPGLLNASSSRVIKGVGSQRQTLTPKRGQPQLF